MTTVNKVLHNLSIPTIVFVFFANAIHQQNESLPEQMETGINKTESLS